MLNLFKRIVITVSFNKKNKYKQLKLIKNNIISIMHIRYIQQKLKSIKPC